MATRYPSVPGVRFKDIDGFPGYCVGDDGSVWSRRRAGGRHPKAKRHVPLAEEWRELRPHRMKMGGYRMVKFRRDGKLFYRKVHHLVLEAFVGPRPPGMCGCHGPNGVDDNSIGNLRWDTPKANSIDRNTFGKAVAGEGHGHAKLTWDDVVAIRAVQNECGATRELARKYGVSRSHIRHIQRGTRWVT